MMQLHPDMMRLAELQRERDLRQAQQASAQAQAEAKRANAEHDRLQAARLAGL